MGGDIAAWCALRGLTVTLQDRAIEFVMPAMERAKQLFAKRLKAPGAAVDASKRMQMDIDAEHVGSADVIIEAIVEDLDVKREMFVKLEQKSHPTALLATNTSSIRIEEIASSLADPSRLVGIHFFNPVSQLQLVEVIRGSDTATEAVQAALSFVTQIGKLPLPCFSAPGFVVNRVLMPYMLEALLAAEDGLAVETIDAAAKKFGMPMGPIELADRVGLDVAQSVANILSQAFGREVPITLGRMVKEGRLGHKCRLGGFYRYRDGRPVKAAKFAPPGRELIDRLLLPLVNECMACLSDGVVNDADLLDAGVVFGTGFAPHTGGPMRYARNLGHDVVADRLTSLAEQYGSRFAPHPGWRDRSSLA
jgi:3-hydroxyacyl-CoA dehydrogenase/enoyl-CoA hydratase/3-hydroxybutyryl-CoA epimerase